MQLSLLCCHRVDAEEDGIDRAGYRHISCRKDVSIECIGHFFSYIDSFDLVDLDLCVETYISESVPVDASCNGSCAVLTVSDADVVEEDTFVIYVECTVCIVRYIGICYLQQGILQACAFAADREVVKRTGHDDVSGNRTAEFAEYFFHERLCIRRVHVVQ